MLTILAMAAQAGPASAGDPRGFLAAFALFHAIVVAQFLRAARLYPSRRPFAHRYAGGFGAAAALWLLSAWAPEGARPILWGAALAIDLLTPWLAVRSVPERTFDVGHIPERYGLFTIIVLGEAIIAVGRGTADSQWSSHAVFAALSGFAIAVAIWGTYFARHNASLLLRGRPWAFLWGYGHLFVWAAIAMTGVGIELAIAASEARQAMPPGQRLVLCGGLALFLAAVALLRAAQVGRLGDPAALLQFASAGLVAAIGLAAGALPAEQLVAALAAVALAAGLGGRQLAGPIAAHA
jgi:low temperature requirement protein LtrA